jgi:hypothetical protein
VKAKRQRYALFLATQFHIAAGMLRIAEEDELVEDIMGFNHEQRKQHRTWLRQVLANAQLPQLELWKEPSDAR